MRALLLFGSSVLALSGTPLRAETEKTPLNHLLGLGGEISVGAFIDTYASYDFNEFEPRTRAYLTQPGRDREYNVNLAHAELTLLTDRYRGRLAAQAGTSVDINYAAEPESWVKYIQEAYAGAKLGENLWLDAGVYFSHIGIENWVSRENWAYTRSLMSEFSPYYQSGLRLSYEPSPSWSLQLQYMNGWQNISDFSGRNAVGTHITYTFENGLTLSHNTFLGNETEGTRFFNNFILQPPAIGALEYAFAFDIGDQDRPEGRSHDQWWAYALLMRYSFSDSLRLAGRVEQYSDPDSVIVSTPTGESFKTVGLSIGLDIELSKRLWWRNEYRALLARAPIFSQGREDTEDIDHFLVTSLSYSL